MQRLSNIANNYGKYVLVALLAYYNNGTEFNISFGMFHVAKSYFSIMLL